MVVFWSACPPRTQEVTGSKCFYVLDIGSLIGGKLILHLLGGILKYQILLLQGNHSGRRRVSRRRRHFRQLQRSPATYIRRISILLTTTIQMPIVLFLISVDPAHFPPLSTHQHVRRGQFTTLLIIRVLRHHHRLHRGRYDLRNHEEFAALYLSFSETAETTLDSRIRVFKCAAPIWIHVSRIYNCITHRRLQITTTNRFAEPQINWTAKTRTANCERFKIESTWALTPE